MGSDEGLGKTRKYQHLPLMISYLMKHTLVEIFFSPYFQLYLGFLLYKSKILKICWRPQLQRSFFSFPRLVRMRGLRAALEIQCAFELQGALESPCAGGSQGAFHSQCLFRPAYCCFGERDIPVILAYHQYCTRHLLLLWGRESGPYWALVFQEGHKQSHAGALGITGGQWVIELCCWLQRAQFSHQLQAARNQGTLFYMQYAQVLWTVIETSIQLRTVL